MTSSMERQAAAADWDSESDQEEAVDARKAIESNADFVQIEQQDATGKPKRKAKQTPLDSKHKASRVVYLGRIPHGFYEDQMRGFFQQFGRVTQLRLSRNKRTGKSKHYAFLEFEDPEVAQIVAKTMHGYRLFDHVLSCHVLPATSVHQKLFAGANKTFKPYPWQAIARKQHNAERTYKQEVARNKKLVRKDKQKRAALQALGIDYDFPGYAAKAAPKKHHIVFGKDGSAKQ